MVMEGLEARAVDLGGDHLHVELRHTDGRHEFSADFQPEGDTYRVSNQLYSLDASGGSGAPQREERLLPRTPASC
jgi:hypothetical protein